MHKQTVIAIILWRKLIFDLIWKISDSVTSKKFLAVPLRWSCKTLNFRNIASKIIIFERISFRKQLLCRYLSIKKLFNVFKSLLLVIRFCLNLLWWSFSFDYTMKCSWIYIITFTETWVGITWVLVSCFVK